MEFRAGEFVGLLKKRSYGIAYDNRYGLRMKEGVSCLRHSTSVTRSYPAVNGWSNLCCASGAFCAIRFSS